jgi:hypothetical protein
MAEENTRYIAVKLPDEQIIHLEAEILGGREDVAFGMPDFAEVTNAVEGIARAIGGVLERVKPQKAAVEFGVEIALESGQLTAILVKGAGKANLKITLEWGGK